MKCAIYQKLPYFIIFHVALIHDVALLHDVARHDVTSFVPNPLQLSGDTATAFQQVDCFTFVMFEVIQSWCHHLQVDCLIFSFMAMLHAVEATQLQTTTTNHNR